MECLNAAQLQKSELKNKKLEVLWNNKALILKCHKVHLPSIFSFFIIQYIATLSLINHIVKLSKYHSIISLAHQIH